jgi:hypothetical protein
VTDDNNVYLRYPTEYTQKNFKTTVITSLIYKHKFVSEDKKQIENIFVITVTL